MSRTNINEVVYSRVAKELTPEEIAEFLEEVKGMPKSALLEKHKEGKLDLYECYVKVLKVIDVTGHSNIIRGSYFEPGSAGLTFSERVPLRGVRSCYW